MYSQKILNKQDYKIWIDSKDGKQFLLPLLSNKYYSFQIIISKKTKIDIVIENVEKKKYTIFDDYVTFKNFYEAQNNFVTLPDKIEDFFEDNEVFAYEISLKEKILKNNESILNELLDEYEITIYPHELNEETLIDLEQQFKNYRVQKESKSKFRLLFSYYFIKYFRLKVESQQIVTSFVNILSEEVFVPNLKKGDLILDIYGIVHTNEFLNRIVNIRLLKEEIDALVAELGLLKDNNN